MTEAKSDRGSTSNFLSVHAKSRELSPVKSECGSAKSSSKRHGLNPFKSIRRAVRALGNFKRSVARDPTIEDTSVISIEKLDELGTNIEIIKDIRKSRPKGPPGRKRSSQMLKVHSVDKIIMPIVLETAELEEQSPQFKIIDDLENDLTTTNTQDTREEPDRTTDDDMRCDSDNLLTTTSKKTSNLASSEDSIDEQVKEKDYRTSIDGVKEKENMANCQDITLEEEYCQSALKKSKVESSRVKDMEESNI